MIKAEQGQNILDLAIQHCGDASSAFEIAFLNGFSLTDDLEPDALLDVPPQSDIAIANFFKNNNLVPATSVIRIISEAEAELKGIEYWAIGVNFIVS